MFNCIFLVVFFSGMLGLFGFSMGIVWFDCVFCKIRFLIG